jgi:putative tricarboxylic transport membrane protein
VRINDAVFGAVLLLFAAAMIWHTRTFPGMPGQDYGPALFPVLIGIGFGVTGLVLVVTGLRRRRAAEPWFAGGDWLRSKRELGGFLAVVLGLLFYILASGWLGFVPTSVLLLTAWLVTFRGGHWVSSAAIAVAVTLAVNYAFTQHLLVPLPLGLLQPIIY